MLKKHVSMIINNLTIEKTNLNHFFKFCLYSCFLNHFCYFVISKKYCIKVGGIGPKQTFSILPSELTTYVTRPMVLWLSTLVYYICAVAITFITPYAMDVMGGYAYIPYIVSFVLVVSNL